MSAKMLGVLRPHIYRFKLGAFEITTIMDGLIQRDGPHPIFGNDQDPKAVKAYAAQHNLPSEMMEHSFTCTVVNTGEKLVLFDTGFGAMMRDKGAGLLRARLQEAGYGPEDIDIVAISHGHPDHIAGLLEDGKPAYPNAEYVFGQVEYEFWRDNEIVPEQRADNREMFMKIAAPFAEQGRLLNEGDEVTPGISAVNAYGHSAGLLAFMVESDGQKLLIWGDVTNHYIMSLQKPEWKVAFDDFPEQAMETRERILGMVASENIWAVGFHMPFPCVGRVEKTPEGYRWVPASYQLNL